MVVEVEDLEDDLDVVDVVKHKVNEVYDVDDGIAVAKLVVDDVHDGDVKDGMPDA